MNGRTKSPKCKSTPLLYRKLTFYLPPNAYLKCHSKVMQRPTWKKDNRNNLCLTRKNKSMNATLRGTLVPNTKLWRKRGFHFQFFWQKLTLKISRGSTFSIRCSYCMTPTGICTWFTQDGVKSVRMGWTSARHSIQLSWEKKSSTRYSLRRQVTNLVKNLPGQTKSTT